MKPPTRRFGGGEPGLNDLLPWAAAVDSGIVQCKDGTFLAGWFYTAPDVSSVTDDQLNYYSHRVNAALSRFGSGWATWTECYRLPAPGYTPPNASHFDHPILRLLDAERRALFTGSGLFSTGHAFLVAYTPPLRVQRRLADLLYVGGRDGQDGYAARALAEFKTALVAIESAIGSDVIGLHRMRGYASEDGWGRSQHRDALVNFLKYAMDGEPGDLNLPSAGAYLDCVLASRELRPGDPLLLGNRCLRAINIEGYPAECYPQILEALNYLPMPYRWSSRMIYLDRHDALANLQRFRRHWTQQVRGFWSQVFRTGTGQVNEDALEMAVQANAAIKDASAGLVTFGFYTSVVVLSSDDQDEIEDWTGLVQEAVQKLGFATRVETDNAVEAWLGSLPGNRTPNIRRPHIHTAILADLMPLSAPWTGEDEAPCPFYPHASPPLLHAVTTGATPFCFNLHVHDLGHTMILGPTGAGKSVLLSTIALSAFRYEAATVCCFDKGRSMYPAVRAVGGRHYDIARADDGPAFAPFSVLDADGDVTWAGEWVASCFEMQHGRAMLPDETTATHRALELLRQRPSLRTLSHFVGLVGSQTVREAMDYYTVSGPGGRLFDAREDGIATARFTVFEIGDLIALPDRMALPGLLYLFRVFERSLRGQPAFLILDEAWVMLGHRVFAPKIREWLKTLRKLNCAVILATQSLADALRSGIFSDLIESCPTKIFLPNADALVAGTAEYPGPRDLYAMFGLNEAELEIVRTAQAKRHYFIVKPERRALMDLALGPVFLSFSALSEQVAPVAVARIDALVQAHGEDWPYHWLQEKGIEYEHLV